ncbi:MAG: hypothetical protein QGI45_14520 [Myxococcota bacterium]|jgi:hypothetical protein|nr:hypothetical protein [Myxococcota bacterium]
MTTETVVQYDASDDQEKADALEFGRLIRRLRLELEAVAEFRDLSASADDNRAGVLELNAMIRRALAQSAPQISIPDNATDPIDTWCPRCYNTGLAAQGSAFVSCPCLDETILPVTVVRLGARSVGEVSPLAEFLRYVRASTISKANRDALVALSEEEEPATMHDERWAAVRADGMMGIGATPIEALLDLEQQYERGCILDSIARRRDPMPEQFRSDVMQVVSKEIKQFAQAG